MEGKDGSRSVLEGSASFSSDPEQRVERRGPGPQMDECPRPDAEEMRSKRWKSARDGPVPGTRGGTTVLSLK